MPGMDMRPQLTWSTAFSQWTFAPAMTALLLVAARAGTTRLIDNAPVGLGGPGRAGAGR